MATRKSLLAVVFAALTAVALSAQAPAPAVMWGSAQDVLRLDGLRVGISSQSTTAPLERAGFDISLQNVGAKDFVLNLGIMLGNGREMFPQAIRLVLTNPEGRSRELEISTPRIAGRVDDFIVALRRGATYVLPITVDQYSSPETGEFGVKLKPGRNRISARFEGRGAAIPNLDMRGVALLNFWLGTVDSGVLQFDAR
jgi:hypothetical protein